MDGQRFDHLTRILGGATSRRSALKVLASAAVVGIVGRPRGSAAAPERFCSSPCQLAWDVFQECNRGCKKERPEFKGSCYSGCAAMHVHMGKECREQSFCPPANLCCGERCVDPQTDAAHCGSCGNACEAGETCQRGTCYERDCAVGEVVCLGECHPQCPDGQVMDPGSFGDCVCRCPIGQRLCGESCVDPTCPPDQRFDETACRCACPAETTLCGGTCVQYDCPTGQRFNPATCGCEDDCAAGVPCGDGCCGDGQSCCSTGCCDGACGPDGGCHACGVVCEAPFVLDPATCACRCPAGTVPCDGACVSNDCGNYLAFNLQTCRCECPALGCYDPLASDGDRVDPARLDPATCQCGTVGPCPPSRIVNGQPVTCSERTLACPPETLPDNTLACTGCTTPNVCCPSDSTCCLFQTYYEGCTESACCAPGYVCNPYPGVTTEWGFYDPCVCPSGVVCNGACCPAGQGCDATTGACA